MPDYNKFATEATPRPCRRHPEHLTLVPFTAGEEFDNVCTYHLEELKRWRIVNAVTKTRQEVPPVEFTLEEWEKLISYGCELEPASISSEWNEQERKIVILQLEKWTANPQNKVGDEFEFLDRITVVENESAAYLEHNRAAIFDILTPLESLPEIPDSDFDRTKISPAWTAEERAALVNALAGEAAMPDKQAAELYDIAERIKFLGEKSSEFLEENREEILFGYWQFGDVQPEPSGTMTANGALAHKIVEEMSKKGNSK